MFEKLRDEPATTDFFLDLLNLLETKLLRMRPNERANCEGIVEKLKEINARCKDDTYCTERVHKPQRAETNLSELMATPLAPSFQEVEKKEMPLITQPDISTTDAQYPHLGKFNGHQSLPRTRRVATAPELSKSSYNAERATQPTPARQTKNGYVAEPADMYERFDVYVEQDKELPSTKEVQSDGKDQPQKPPFETKASDDSAIDMTYDINPSRALQSTQKKRDMPEMDGEETSDPVSRKRART